MMQGQIQKSEEIRPEITVNIIFGMPSRDCAYYGICKMDHGDDEIEKRAKHLGVAILQKEDNAHLLLKFKKESIKKGTYRKYFGSKYFLIIEDFILPDYLTKK